MLSRSIVAILMRRRHAHGRIDGWWGSWTVRSASRARVVLAPAPAETDSGVADRVALHLVDSHFCCMTLDELDETTALARWNLDIGDLAKALEERAELILSDIAREATNEDGGIVGISELVHGLGLTTIVGSHGSWRTTHWRLAIAAAAAHRPTHRPTHHRVHAAWTPLVLWGGCRNAHRSITAVDALHLIESTLLVLLIGESNKTIATRHARDWIGHDLSGLA